GAFIIDVGGESTRPGSEEVSIDVELARVEPVVRTLVHEGILVSIDTRHAEVAAACINQGAVAINDITGFTQASMREVAQQNQVGCIIMHMQGEPKNMQAAPHYDDVVQEVEDFLLAQALVLEEGGVARERIAIDPGPGFGKDFDHNLALLHATRRFASHGYPLVAAWSRKAFIGALTGVSVPAQRVAGSVEVAMYAAQQGARILRVHDVAPTAQALVALAHGHHVSYVEI
ncbi:MAG: dihydropteroate synthase, partial [Coriobacteriia bacterium]|nr:dihydropteroate synthase [Coriobacteriia bacterium]